MKDNRLQQAKELQEKVMALQQKKKRLESEAMRKVSWENRKARTKRLIETGALAEKYFGLEELSVEDREKVFQTFSSFVKSKILEKN
ncbi:hypothetical protein [Paenisporosarcina sp. OV554]|uniref:hypothetical protein n=1 Tax=Paenisporosarcina sp. OV554 TaxID=2135694 RepID=UPI000D3C3F84|nr:hypothetical protein [Paenisporosarcina sp. OV554]PUB08369.1 relaxasome subunit MobC [Paenisporosarcina sp. OV554]